VRDINASELATRALAGATIAGRPVVARILPVRFADAASILLAHIAELSPELVIATGEADRPAVSVERLAVNRTDARLPDNAGAQPRDVAVIAGAPPSYPTALPVDAIVAAIAALDIPVAASDSAGAFVCNHVFYALMHARVSRAGFVHVPATALPAPTIARALSAAIAAALSSPEA
jgi:pyroglutamyl-peptidase